MLPPPNVRAPGQQPARRASTPPGGWRLRPATRRRCWRRRAGRPQTGCWRGPSCGDAERRSWRPGRGPPRCFAAAACSSKRGAREGAGCARAQVRGRFSGLRGAPFGAASWYGPGCGRFQPGGFGWAPEGPGLQGPRPERRGTLTSPRPLWLKTGGERTSPFSRRKLGPAVGPLRGTRSR